MTDLTFPEYNPTVGVLTYFGATLTAFVLVSTPILTTTQAALLSGGTFVAMIIWSCGLRSLIRPGPIRHPDAETEETDAEEN